MAILGGAKPAVAIGSENVIYDSSSDGDLSTTRYSREIDMTDAEFVDLSIAFTLGSLTDCVLSAQVWNGTSWVALYSASSTQWSITLSSAFSGAVLVGDPSTVKFLPRRIAWDKVRIKITPSGTSTGSAIVLRIATG